MRDIETCLRAHSAKLYHLGIRGGIARSTLADANENRDWRIYKDFALSLIQAARKPYAVDSFGLELAHTVYALDSTTIDLCLALFPWARFRKRKGAVKLHTLLDLQGNIPTFIHVSDSKFHDVKNDKSSAFLTNNFDFPALAVIWLYRCRWQVELFFKWIKQRLRIKAFFGTSENAVRFKFGSPSPPMSSSPFSKDG